MVFFFLMKFLAILLILTMIYSFLHIMEDEIYLTKKNSIEECSEFNYFNINFWNKSNIFYFIVLLAGAFCNLNILFKCGVI